MNSSLLAKFFRYLRHPTYYIENPRKNIFRILFDISRLMSFLYIFIILFGIVDFVILSITKYDVANHAVSNLIDSEPILLTFFLSCILAPITEETTFRLGLRFSYKKFAIAATFIFIVLFDLLKDFVITSIPAWILSLRSVLGGFTYIAFIILVFLIVFFAAKKFIKFEEGERFYNKHLGKLFYISAILFAATHIPNYTNPGNLIFLTPILVLPQLAAGIFFGYIRMNYGFKWNILTHGTFNFIALLPFILLKVLNISTDNIDAKNLTEYQTGGIVLIGVGAMLAFVLFLSLNLQLVVEYFLKRKKTNNS